MMHQTSQESSNNVPEGGREVQQRCNEALISWLETISEEQKVQTELLSDIRDATKSTRSMIGFFTAIAIIIIVLSLLT